MSLLLNSYFEMLNFNIGTILVPNYIKIYINKLGDSWLHRSENPPTDLDMLPALHAPSLYCTGC